MDIQWTSAAKDDYIELLKETYAHSVEQAIALDEKMESLLGKLQRFKFMCPPSRQFPKFRRCVLTNHVSLVYEVGSDGLTILSIFDSRRNSPFN
jgi:plasmid stabilization system protein ParE